jgi:hypothetical protein
MGVIRRLRLKVKRSKSNHPTHVTMAAPFAMIVINMCRIQMLNDIGSV